MATHSPAVHDFAQFPLVRFRPESICPGYGPAWCADMDALIARGERFVLIYPPITADETLEDRKCRCAWLRDTRSACGAVCVALVAIEPDAARRRVLEHRLPGLARAFGTNPAVAPSLVQAEALGQHLLDMPYACRDA
jgi:hypothetical protein